MIIGFISIGFILLGLGGVFFILSRQSRSLSDEDVNRLAQNFAWYRRLERWWHEHFKESLESGTFEQKLSLIVEKMLRSFHVTLLRLDNRLHVMIQRLRENRSERQVDKEYWANIQNFALKERIDKLFRDIKKSYHRDAFDPVQEERLLLEGGINEPERWFNLIRFYLAKEHLSEARRIVIQYWRQNKQDENIFILLEGVIHGPDSSSSTVSEPASQEPKKEL
jgi:hypothetical protein